jgi:Xaa-Pro dipeptidase
MMNIYKDRRKKLYDWMAREGIVMVMFEDTEGRRDPSIRWLSGQPSDALLFLSVDQKWLLVPWDANMAALDAQATVCRLDTVIPYGEFERQAASALKKAAELFKIPVNSRVEIPPVTSYINFLTYVEEISEFDILCRKNGAHAEAEACRAIKDELEQSIYRKAAARTNEVIELLEKNIRSGKLVTELDTALFIETEARKRGCEGTGFETLAAGPNRSFGIHAFPAYTADPFGGPGLSILDFGLKYQGYTTDVTMTFARSPLNPAQEKMLSLTEKAYAKALSMVKPGAACRDIAAAVDAIFHKAKKTMPHGLGHSIGLEAHENPVLRSGTRSEASSRSDNADTLLPGMVFTLEPGLYDPVHGGCRLENDILLTEKGAEVLTTSRIVRM